MKLLTRQPDTDVEALRCARCDSVFRAALTGWSCPVCGWEVDRPEATGLAGWFADPSNRIVALVAGATLANGLLLLMLAIAVSRAG